MLGANASRVQLRPAVLVASPSEGTAGVAAALVHLIENVPGLRTNPLVMGAGFVPTA